MLFYTVMLLVGFVFVNVVNLRNERKNPFKGSDGTYADFKKTVLASVIVFFTSAIVMLKQTYDLSSYCTPGQEHTTPNIHAITENAIHTVNYLNTDSVLPHIFMSIEKMNYAGMLKTPACHLYTDYEVFFYNYYIWTTGFFIGLQFTHMDVGFLQQFTLDWNVMKNWPWYLWVLFVGLITLLGSIASYVFYLYYTVGFFMTYIYLIGGAVGLIWLRGKMLGPNYHLHIHHYFLGMFVSSIICYQNTFLTLVHSIFNGIMMEGGCRWGFSPIFDDGPASLASIKLA